MKKLLCLGLLWGMVVFPTQAQSPYQADHESLDAIMEALYEVISGAQGEARNWERFEALFIPEARLMPTGSNPETGKIGMRVWSPQDYIQMAGSRLEQMGFYEQEIHRVVEAYGPITHVFSTYESRHAPDEAPFVRGINSIQLLNDGERWWIVSIYWSGETNANPLPAKYGGE